MPTTFVYPGSFSPPTYGHLDIVRQISALTPRLIIICSINNDKSSLFTPEEAVNLWHSYDLPYNVDIMTLAEFVALNINPNHVIMVRGIRDTQDFDYEKKVSFFNRDNFGLNKFLYIMSDPEFKEISSTKARTTAYEMRLTDLRKMVSAQTATALLEKILHLNNLILVVGRPGSGKSTFLRQLAKLDPNNVHINTDDFNHSLQPLLRQIFQEEDLTKIALIKEKELKEVIAKPWMEMLIRSLRNVPSQSNVFVEIPYAFKSRMELYKLLGGKTIYIDCNDVKKNEQRLNKRGTPHHCPFVSAIPDWEKTRFLADSERILIGRIDTGGSLAQMKKKAQWLFERLNGHPPLLPFPNYVNSGPGVQSITRRVPSLSFRNRSYLQKVGD